MKVIKKNFLIFFVPLYYLTRKKLETLQSNKKFSIIFLLNFIDTKISKKNFKKKLTV